MHLGIFTLAINYAPFFVAQQKHWFEDALAARDVKVEYTEFQSLPAVNEAFATGRVDAVFEAEIPAIIGRAADIDLRIVSMPCRLTIGILANASSGVHSVAGLRGAKVAVLEGTAMHFALLKAAERVGLDPTEFDVINMSPPDARNAFDTGQVQAWAVWPPWPEQEEIARRGIILPGSEVTIESLLVVRGEFSRNHRELVDALVGVTNRSRDWIAHNVAGTQDLVCRRLRLQAAVVAKAWPRENFDGTLTDALIDDLQSKADFLYQNRYIKKTIDVRKDLIDLHPDK